MSSPETISISLSPEMLSEVREAVDTGEYASSTEVVRDALLDWTRRRRIPHVGDLNLKDLWTQALEDNRPAAPMEEVMDRLKAKYRAIAEASAPAE